jgi:hypothetical protein
MNCIKHPAVVANVACSACAEPFCDSCLVTVKGQKYCAECKNSAIKGDAVVANQGPAGVCEEAGEALKYSIIGLFCFGFILGPIGVSKALKAKKMIRENPRLEGSGKATAALIVGIVATILSILMIVGRIAMVGRSGD